ncbi:MAG: PspC domain-containing protein [Candidatus Nanoarchaeia archaeon]|nr:PspC domain-containing protein [Candidatus Nanoarchaeia archaeon]MDD5053759.1 PspC domain-containing protein [Candidatus Nanoarchaeia archaeon]MDD5499966.1 PspC domain-containing protein [Candidatus Nanoarchaeia archaeon]
MQEKIFKSKSDKIIFGVCGGIAQYFKIDSSIARILAALLLIMAPGFIIPLYVILAIILPINPSEKVFPLKKSNNSQFLGAGLIIAGAFILLDYYGIISWKNTWPALLIIIGALMIWGQRKK